MRDLGFFTHNLYMELQQLAMLIAEEFVTVLADTFDQIVAPEPEDDSLPKVMIAGR